MKSGLFAFLGFAFFTSAFAAGSASNPGADLPSVQTVDYVDLTRYVGKWYQIAFFPTRFQGSCTIDTTATYGIMDDGRVSVFNECKKPSGKTKSISGSAKIVDRDSNAKLKVKFFWFAPAGDYWIIDLGSNYEYAVVGSPDRKYLWILSRTPQITNSLYQDLVKRASSQYFDVNNLQLTSQLLP
jgi:apolipoprotein D and lipocalin family protein